MSFWSLYDGAAAGVPMDAVLPRHGYIFSEEQPIFNDELEWMAFQQAILGAVLEMDIDEVAWVLGDIMIRANKAKNGSEGPSAGRRRLISLAPAQAITRATRHCLKYQVAEEQQSHIIKFLLATIHARHLYIKATQRRGTLEEEKQEMEDFAARARLSREIDEWLGEHPSAEPDEMYDDLHLHCHSYMTDRVTIQEPEDWARFVGDSDDDDDDRDDDRPREHAPWVPVRTMWKDMGRRRSDSSNSGSHWVHLRDMHNRYEAEDEAEDRGLEMEVGLGQAMLYREWE
ncbi:hypothetical protein F4677DRAFT_465151 [Hypoxylon crocopeplum]|nr:hypothetical protein F4677DRAFT_465151 [Hypoxylon crocopeplum]